ncbi:HET domain-containing protein [Pochonia chlamydosporia 170]|uniref:HET domain-containing protein n=1 Tax=Pochonia chlamydosporia 170 TaxID=1380566 RepID=A0A179FXN3_METCM|nr:HET domain-containing protein [Pochonia chlamydosporia 170]OAQ69940.2 HET domain-containing protein [Pochonia chlamydosporia 170]
MPIRLINTATLSLKEFMGEIPDYAILSHTWVTDEEVTFQEIDGISRDPDHSATKKSGYHKIRATCETCRGHGFQYVWIDTCCIDKSSSAELNEAINSMFKWYENAKTCYVYLADLTAKPSYTESLKHCRWLTRGWCLQELLAPRDVRFYGANWDFIGTKIELQETLSDLTGIDDDVLNGNTPLHAIPVARRMSWAARRNTTRMEDTAYCLLGIFDINMPMLYGEGEKAFLRLQEEIIRRSNDLSIFCHSELLAGPLPEREEEEEDASWHSQYQDLFAQSPADFGLCGNVVAKMSPSLSLDVFELTNVGLHFKDVSLHLYKELDERPDGTEVGYQVFGLYGIQLKCSSWPRRTQCCMYLRKVGPGLYVRVRVNTDFFWQLSDTSNEEIYILPKITTEIRPRLDRSHDNAIQFRLEGALKWCILGDPVPHDRWDAPTSQFLNFASSSFRGYVGVRVGSNPFFSEVERINIYVVCGQRPHPFGVWVHLVSEEHLQESIRGFGNVLLALPSLIAPLKRFPSDLASLQVSDKRFYAQVRHLPSRSPRFIVTLTCEYGTGENSPSDSEMGEG